jgi:antirestriction protein ArdC
MPATKTRKAPATEEQKAEWAAAREAKLEAAHAQLTAGVDALTGGEEWKRMLDTAAKFHRYSLNNILLILIQRPDATNVAGFGTWKSLGRSVRKGERGITILRPNLAWFDQSGARVYGRISAEVARARGLRKRVVSFGTAAVFDVDQTEGEPLTVVDPRLEGEGDPEVWDALVDYAARELQRPVELDDSEGAANGWATPNGDDAKIVVRTSQGRSTLQQLKTLVHEIGHVMLGHTDPKAEHPLTREVREVEAESVAFVVLNGLGFNSADYSLPYVAHWAGDASAEVLAETARRVVKAAHDVIVAVAPPAPEGDED